ncbi:hypothetical protein P5G51_005480 [Virgibacillus sp. 179-BFC.A HS]|uniref:Uncharacterized protein n=1 Tax=Tigheibacillus jepli TaxID=3035914 RepID=A0ABU5CGC1_9BACI|nr:hypothetical protein [Virgibacillus sp. 179-BFC.A HS]MDY0404922.1 hypothetical protein [Virgibacillus sp. 179-BFC.A HS]
MGIVATSVAGPKGVGPLTKSGAASAKSGVAAAKTGVKQAVNYAKKQIFPDFFLTINNINLSE